MSDALELPLDASTASQPTKENATVEQAPEPSTLVSAASTSTAPISSSAPAAKKVAAVKAKKTTVKKADAAKKTTATTAAGDGAGAKKSSHPTFREMIMAAIKKLDEKNGSSRQAIVNYIMRSYQVGDNAESVNTNVKAALKRMVTANLLKQITGKGASGSFKIAANGKEDGAVVKKVRKIASKKKAETAPLAVKKAVAKKTESNTEVAGDGDAKKKEAKPKVKKATVAAKKAKAPTAKKPATKKAATAPTKKAKVVAVVKKVAKKAVAHA